MNANHLWKTSIIVVVLVSIFLAIFLFYKPSDFQSDTSTDSVSYTVPKTVRYNFTVKNKTNQLIEKAQFWTYAPVAQNSTQKVTNIKATLPYELTVDETGNQVLSFVIENLPPYGNKVLTITTELLFAEASNPQKKPLLDSFLVSERFVEVAHPKITSLAQKMLGTDPMLTSKSTYQWVADNIQYAGYINDDRGALYALNKKKGDCTEYMYLFVALMRANGIPARGVGGYVYPHNAILKSRDYHNWAEVYIDGAWRLVDPQNRVFMEQSTSYVAMRIISASEKNPLANTHRFLHSDNGIVVTMN
ncbi:MAG: transglutaminase-like domain-containing protein [Gammaproteobacteria bacterium]|nr:transglutaminase-like domain-containing protein [Gammaproteobacteria bacterium]